MQPQYRPRYRTQAQPRFSPARAMTIAVLQTLSAEPSRAAIDLSATESLISQDAAQALSAIGLTILELTAAAFAVGYIVKMLKTSLHPRPEADIVHATPPRYPTQRARHYVPRKTRIAPETLAAQKRIIANRNNLYLNRPDLYRRQTENLLAPAPDKSLHGLPATYYYTDPGQSRPQPILQEDETETEDYTDHDFDYYNTNDPSLYEDDDTDEDTEEEHDEPENPENPENEDPDKNETNPNTPDNDNAEGNDPDQHPNNDPDPDHEHREPQTHP